MDLAHPTLNAEQRDAVAIDHFLDALNDAEFALKVRQRAPASLVNALRVALQLEAWYRDANANSTTGQPGRRGSTA